MNEKPKRSWLQFSVRTLFVVVAVLAIVALLALCAPYLVPLDFDTGTIQP